MKKTKNNDPIINLFKNNADKLIEAIYAAEIKRPNVTNQRQYRMLIPKFTDYFITKFFNNELICPEEHKGKTYDWIILGKKISIKSTKLGDSVFPAKKKGGKFTKPKSIGLINTYSNTSFTGKEFDYLLVIERGFGFYLFDMEQVKKSLKNNSFSYDGKGQIKLFLEDKESALIYREITNKEQEKLSQKYQRNSLGDQIFLVKLHKMIEGLCEN